MWLNFTIQATFLQFGQKFEVYSQFGKILAKSFGHTATIPKPSMWNTVDKSDQENMFGPMERYFGLSDEFSGSEDSFDDLDVLPKQLRVPEAQRGGSLPVIPDLMPLVLDVRLG